MSAEVKPKVQVEIGHVLFIDVVGYSTLSVNEQHQIQQQLNEIVRGTERFRAAPEDKLTTLPTGDGMALVFFTSPEAPVECAIEISSELKRYPRFELRMGIHSGPVSRTTDVNQRTNIAGAGINIAQRVMDCGDAGHILLSRRVADDLAQYGEWQPCLHELREVEVKHGVRVALVNFFSDGFGNSKIPAKIIQAQQIRRRRLLLWLSAVLLCLLFATVGSWIWTRRVALSTAYKVSAAGISEKSIAVLPFENFEENKENAYFADGIQDDILTDLAKVADLKVISRRSVAQYRGSTQDMREIGKALQVAHVLEGTVRKIGDKIRVTAQLIDTRTEAQTWAEKYERNVADVFAIQSEVSQAIVTQLKAALSPREKAAIEEKPTEDPEAYDLYLRARSLIREPGVTVKIAQGDTAKGVTLLESAIGRDPKFTLAYCLLSEAQLSLYGLEYWNKERLPKAKAAIDTALRISPNSGQAHLTLAEYLFRAVRDPERAERELTIAATALPGHVELFNLGADIAEQRGQWTKALQDRGKAAELDPRDQETASNLVTLYTNLRRYADAQKLIDHTIATIPQQSTSPFWRQKSKILLAKGDTDAAMAALDASPNRNIGLVGLNSEVANVFVMEHNYAKAEEILRSAEEVARAHNVMPKGADNPAVQGVTLLQLGRIARVQGQQEKARDYFESARKGFEAWLAKNPEQSSIYEARARAFIAEVDAALGRKEDALREAHDVLELWPLSRDATVAPNVATIVAVAYVWAGEHDAALQLLAQFAKLPCGPTVGDLKLNPVWDDLRNDPRFDKIIAKATEPVKLD